MKLNGAELLKLSGAQALNADKTSKLPISGVTIDSRKFRKNEVFFAIKGERFDGHNFVKDVLGKGITAVVAEKKWYSKLGAADKSSMKNKNVVLVKDTIRSLGEFARNYRRKFLIPVIAVAGSNGKTTTKDFMAHVLSSKYEVLKTEGNLNNAIGVPLTLLKMRKEHEMCVLELGTNHFGEVAYLCSVSEPQFGLITNIGKEHLEYFKDIKGVMRAESELMDYLAENYGTYFLNSDDRYLSGKAKGKEFSLFSYGEGAGADVKGRIRSFYGFYPEIDIRYNDKKINTVLNSIGSQSFYSALPAAAVGFYFEVPVSGIRKSLKEFASVTAKRNRLINSNRTWIIDDTYNSNPDSVKIALENLKTYKTKGSKHIVLADMLELGKSSTKEHKDIGILVKKMGFNSLYTYGDKSLNTFKGAKGIKFNFHFNDKQSLAETLLHMLKKGDTVLVKGSRSMKMEEIVNQLTAIN